MNKNANKKQETKKEKSFNIPPELEDIILGGLRLASESVTATEDLNDATKHLTEMLRSKNFNEKKIEQIHIQSATNLTINL